MQLTAEDLALILRKQNISVTPQRVQILKNIMERHDHPSADNIFQEVRRVLPMISFNTVYKTLETFCQLGLIMKVNPLHEVARYDGNTTPHAHVICRRCRQVEDLYWDRPQEIPPPDLGASGFQAESMVIQVFGLCRHCQEESAASL
ncbi:MAG: Fur family transcriptional regulator [Desulfobacca sp.]|uniref:Fur family transcriptional regulator n=1 Tax=Desulfobacca sp. TaxID=2067990 RepID=UPI0040496A1B